MPVYLRRDVALVVSTVLFLTMASQFIAFYQDDSYIYCRYVRNILDGHGPVFNIGDPTDGELLPNTYFAKQGSFSLVSAGTQYLLGWSPWVLLPTIGILYRTFRYRDGLSESFFVVTFSLTMCLHLSLTGGDFMRGYRSALPMAPIILWCCLSIWRKCATQIATFAVTIQIILQIGLSINIEKSPEWTSIYGRTVGEYINKNWPDSAVVALNTAGSTAYYWEHQVIDMLGLTDKTIAQTTFDETLAQKVSDWALVPGHRRGNGAYVLDRAPDYIIIGTTHGSVGKRGWQPLFIGDQQLVEDPRLKKLFTGISNAANSPGNCCPVPKVCIFAPLVYILQKKITNSVLFPFRGVPQSLKCGMAEVVHSIRR